MSAAVSLAPVIYHLKNISILTAVNVLSVKIAKFLDKIVQTKTSQITNLSLIQKFKKINFWMVDHFKGKLKIELLFCHSF